MAKIEPLEPIYNKGGTIYYAGWVNDEYVHFLSLDKLSRSDVKSKLLKKYNKEHNKEEEECQYGKN